MDKFMNKLLNWKLLLLVYFGGGIFTSSLVDLIFIKRGAISTPLIWQILLVAVVCASVQTIFEAVYGDGEVEVMVIKPFGRLMFLHLGILYLSILAMAFLFKWVSRTALGFVMFSIVFLVIYAGLFVGFSVTAAVKRKRLNEMLKEYKSGPA